MRFIVADIVAGLLIGLLALAAVGLLIAAAVVGFADLVGVGGALAIVGGGLAVLVMVTLTVAQSRYRRRVALRRAGGFSLGSMVAGFMLGVWDGVRRPRGPDRY